MNSFKLVNKHNGMPVIEDSVSELSLNRKTTTN